jgi:hypothetical protein
MGPSAGQTLTDKLDKMDGIDLEVSRTMSNTEYALPAEEYFQLLEEIRKTKAVTEKGATINWPAFGKSHISEYGKKMVLCMLFPWLYPGGNGDFNESRTVNINIKDWARQQLFLDDGRSMKDKTGDFMS